MNRIEAINRVIEDTKAQSLLYISHNEEIHKDIKCNNISRDPFGSYDVVFIDGAFAYDSLSHHIEELNAKVLVLTNVLPISEDYTALNWCGESFKIAWDIHKRTPYYKILRQDHGVLVVNLEDISDMKQNGWIYTNLDDLLKTFNILSNIDDLLFEFPTDLPDEPLVGYIDDYEKYSDEELRGVYKQLSGKGLRGKFNREKAIQKIKDLL